MPRPYTLYTLQERSTILAVAVAEALTAREVHARFGVNPHTYYAWRRKAGLRGRRGRRPRESGKNGAAPRRQRARVAFSSVVEERTF